MKKFFLLGFFLFFSSLSMVNASSVLNFRSVVKVPGLEDISITGKMNLIMPANNGKVEGVFNILQPEAYKTAIQNGFRIGNEITGSFIVRIPESYFADWLNVKEFADVKCQMHGTLTPLGILNGKLIISFINPTHTLLKIFSLESDFIATY